jgi:hypothetical protein
MLNLKPTLLSLRNICSESAEVFVHGVEQCQPECRKDGLRILLLQARVTNITLFCEIFLFKRQLVMFVCSVRKLRLMLQVRIV